MTSLSHRAKLIAGLTLVSVIIAVSLEYLLSINSTRAFGHTQQGHILGWIGFVMILLACGYPFRRWLYPNQVWSKAWFQIHQVLGIGGPLLIFVHSGTHLHALVPVLALIMIVLVVLSGIAGQALHHLASQTLYEQRHELARNGIPQDIIEAKLYDLARNEQALRWWRCVHVPLTWTFFSLVILHIGGVLYLGGL